MSTPGPRTILAPGEYTAPDGHTWRALVLIRVGEAGDRHTPPSDHEAECLQPGSVTITTSDGRRHAVGDLAVSHHVRASIEAIALSRLPAPGSSTSAWMRWYEDNGGAL